jgi:hypothetical protein
MSYMMFGLAILALLHFVYESTLAPSFRMKLHFDLCALRGALRRLRLARGQALSQEGCSGLDESLRALDSMLHRFDLGMLAAVRRELARNPALRRHVEQRGRMLDACTVPEAIEIRERLLHIASRALLVNHGAWCIYILPAVLGCLSFRNARRLIGAAIAVSQPGVGAQPGSLSPTIRPSMRLTTMR